MKLVLKSTNIQMHVVLLSENLRAYVSNDNSDELRRKLKNMKWFKKSLILLSDSFSTVKWRIFKKSFLYPKCCDVSKISASGALHSFFHLHPQQIFIQNLITCQTLLPTLWLEERCHSPAWRSWQLGGTDK